MQQTELSKLIEYINPSLLNYQEWINVGMALKHEGYSVRVWDDWSSQDSKRYHPQECEKKWNSFQGTLNPITGGTIFQMATDHGWKPDFEGHELDWDASIGSRDNRVVVDTNWIEEREVKEPETWSPANQLITYLETLFEASEQVGYVTHTYEKDGKYLPSKGVWDRTAGQLIQQLSQCKDDIGSVVGDYKEAAGAWIRFNPLDGGGCKNDNVTEYKYALVESDQMDIDKQNAVIRELELPVACLVHSGGKSLHAVVRVDAADYDEYRKRVDYLYRVCEKNGFKIDSQNRNPSRLSRMPGVIRNGKKQFIVDINIGKKDWNEWYEWIESVNDDLPEPESLKGVWDDLPELADPLIHGVLRQGHKMLIAGPSKAGKSFSLIELTIGIAEGRTWHGWKCAKGKVMYVNLELDRASCLHRFKDVYKTLGWAPDNLSNIDIWNLRGKSAPMDKLAPKLIRRALKKNYAAIIIDPIYKVITGDENSADQMAAFCNQFDKVCTELGAAVIYCHHHSKGSQGSKKAMDRASGSGVFARDPDAILDLIELQVTEELLKQEENKAVCDACFSFLNERFEDWEDDVSQDAMCSQLQMNDYCKKKLTRPDYQELTKRMEVAVQKNKMKSAWRIEGTLREFPKFEPVNLWFDYPVHRVDKVGSLKDIGPEDETPQWKKAASKRKDPEEKKNERKRSLELAYEALKIDGDVTVIALEEYFTLSKNAVKNRVKEHEGFEIRNGNVYKK